MSRGRYGSEAQREAYASADIFCLPTLGDCTPVALNEAQAAGLPIVSTSIASNPECVPDAAGLLVPPGDEQALAQALRALVDDAPRRRAMGEAARAHACELMDAEHNAGRVIEFLRAVA